MTRTIFRLTEFEPDEIPTGPFYIIDDFPYPNFVLDESGQVKSFDSYEEAFTDAEDCQNGYVIQL